MNDILPKNCFVSFSYKDTESLQLLHKSLPSQVEPFMFPPITVAPDEMISNALINAILDRDGLIYLEGGYSAQSFWVAFERDYALRAKKRVFSFNPQTAEVKQANLEPLKLPILGIYTRRDRDHIVRLTHFMKEKRFFDTWIFDERPRSNNKLASKVSRSTLVQRMNMGGYAVVFWSKNMIYSERAQAEFEFALDYNRYYTNDYSQLNLGRVLIALLDDTPLPDWALDKIESDPGSVVKPVQLYSDSQLSATNRLDDLIVRLYWLNYRTTQGNNLEWD
ncbi:MAG: TIR domain-containing protein [Chloroflexota bacterium]